LTLEARDGIPVCTRVTVEAKSEGREVRAVDLRAIRLEDWLEAIIAEVALRVVLTDDAGEPLVVSPGPGTPEAKRLAVAAVREARSNTRKHITDGHLRKVAAVYLADTANAPLKAVGERFGVSKRTAARWVATARDNGFIPERDEK
jgi:hypothetical protein